MYTWLESVITPTGVGIKSALCADRVVVSETLTETPKSDVWPLRKLSRSLGGLFAFPHFLDFEIRTNRSRPDCHPSSCVLLRGTRLVQLGSKRIIEGDAKKRKRSFPRSTNSTRERSLERNGAKISFEKNVFSDNYQKHRFHPKRIPSNREYDNCEKTRMEMEINLWE